MALQTADGTLHGLEMANDEAELSAWFCPSCTYMNPPLVRHCPMCDAANPRWVAQQAAYAAVEAAATAREKSARELVRAKEAASARRDALMQDLEDDFADFSGDEESAAPIILDLPSSSTLESDHSGPTGTAQSSSPPLLILQRQRKHSASPGSCQIDSLPLDLLLQALAFVGHPSSLVRFRAVAFRFHVAAEDPVLWQALGEAAAALNSKPAQGWRRDQILLFQARPPLSAADDGSSNTAEGSGHLGLDVSQATTFSSSSSNTRDSAGTRVTSYEQLGQLLSRANATLEHATHHRAAASTVVPRATSPSSESHGRSISNDASYSSGDNSNSSNSSSSSGRKRDEFTPHKYSMPDDDSLSEDEAEPLHKRVRVSQGASPELNAFTGDSDSIRGNSDQNNDVCNSSSRSSSIQDSNAVGTTSSSSSSGASGGSGMHGSCSSSTSSTSPLPVIALQTGVGGVAAAVARMGGADWYFVARQASTGRLLLAAWQSLSEGWKWVQCALHRLLWACLDNCAKSSSRRAPVSAPAGATTPSSPPSSSSSSATATSRYSRLSAAATRAETAKDVGFNGDQFEARASAVHKASSQRIKLIRCGTLPAADEELLPPDQRAVFARTSHKLQRVNWSLLRTSLLVTMSHVAEGLARYALMAPSSLSSPSFTSEEEGTSGRDDGPSIPEATATDSSSSSSSGDGTDTLGARCDWCWRAYRSWLNGVIGLLGDLEAYLGGERDRDLAMRRPPMPSLAESGVSAFRHAFLLRPPLCRRLVAELLPTMTSTPPVNGGDLSLTVSERASSGEITPVSSAPTPLATAATISAATSTCSLAYHADVCAGSFTNAELGSSYKVFTFVLSQAQAAHKAALKTNQTTRVSLSNVANATTEAAAAISAEADTISASAVRADDLEGVMKMLQAVDSVGDGEVAPIMIPLGKHARPAAVAYGAAHPATNDDNDEYNEDTTRRGASARVAAEREHSQRILDGLNNGVRGMLRRKLLLPLWAHHQEHMMAAGAAASGRSHSSSSSGGRPLSKDDDEEEDEEDCEGGECEGDDRADGTEASDLLLSGFRQSSASAHRRNAYYQRNGRR